jgi:hypothetical protein
MSRKTFRADRSWGTRGPRFTRFTLEWRQFIIFNQQTSWNAILVRLQREEHYDWHGSFSK